MTLPIHNDTTGRPRVLAVLRHRDDFGGLPKFRSAAPVIPRSQWYDFDMSGFPAPVLDQGQHGSCVGHGAVTAFWRSWLIGGGTPHEFSACYIYGQINHGQDQGAIISDAATCLLKKGTCLLDTVPEGMIYKKDFPPGADAEAARFKARMVLHCETFDDVASAILQGFNVVGCVKVGSNFNSLNQYGVPPVSKGYGNHCIMHAGLKKLPDGKWALVTQNSWGTTWGVGGYYHQSEAHYAYQEGVDAFAIKAVAGDPQEQNLPPVALA